MFGFFKKRPTIREDDPFREPLTDDGKTYEEFKESDVAIKIWLPEPLEEKLQEFCKYFSESRPQLLRSIYFVHLYGRYDYEQMRRKSLGIFFRESHIRYSRPAAAVTHRSGPNTTPELGKNNQDMKLWIPSKMRDDLQHLANQAQTPLSQFLREVLVSTMFGHAYPLKRISPATSGEDPASEE